MSNLSPRMFIILYKLKIDKKVAIKNNELNGKLIVNINNLNYN